MRRSCYEAARRKRLAPFRAAGFRCAAAAWALPDAELFARQRRQFLAGGDAVPDAAMADMRGPPCAVYTWHCCRHGKYTNQSIRHPLLSERRPGRRIPDISYNLDSQFMTC